MLPDPAAGLPVEVRAPHSDPFDPRRFVRLLYSQNPFYVLSVCFMLHGTGLWFRDARGEFSPWPLMGLICGYVLLVAAAGFVIVRLWKVWNDARSIFLILLLIATFYHTALGLQVVIEDYVEREWARLAGLLAMRLLCVLFAVRGILAVLKLTLGA